MNGSLFFCVLLVEQDEYSPTLQKLPVEQFFFALWMYENILANYGVFLKIFIFEDTFFLKLIIKYYLSYCLFINKNLPTQISRKFSTF